MRRKIPKVIILNDRGPGIEYLNRPGENRNKRNNLFCPALFFYTFLVFPAAFNWNVVAGKTEAGDSEAREGQDGGGHGWGVLLLLHFFRS